MPVDFEVRIIEMFDKLDVKIDDLCERTARVETILTERKEKKIRSQYVTFSLFGVGIAIYEVLRELFR